VFNGRIWWPHITWLQTHDRLDVTFDHPRRTYCGYKTSDELQPGIPHDLATPTKHLEYKHELEAFRHKHYLSSEEEIEVKRIQKLKLATKDQIMEIVSRHQHADAR